MEQKSRYLHRAAEEKWWVSFAHDDRVYAAKVVNDRGKLVLGDSLQVKGEFGHRETKGA